MNAGGAHGTRFCSRREIPPHACQKLTCHIRKSRLETFKYTIGLTYYEYIDSIAPGLSSVKLELNGQNRSAEKITTSLTDDDLEFGQRQLRPQPPHLFRDFVHPFLLPLL